MSEARTPWTFEATLKSRDVEELVNLHWHRPLAFLVVRALRPWPAISPNHITLMSGTMGVLADEIGLTEGARQLFTAEQAADSSWTTYAYICFGYIFFAYWILWASKTLTFDRKFYVGSEIVFGLLWGLSMGQLLLSFVHLWGTAAGLEGWALYGASYACMGFWQYLFQDVYWDVWVSPEHDDPKSIIVKTILSHIPNVAICLGFLVFFGKNYTLYVLSQTFALVAASIFQRFPAPWAKEYYDPPLTATSWFFGMHRGNGYVGPELDPATRRPPVEAVPEAASSVN